MCARHFIRYPGKWTCRGEKTADFPLHNQAVSLFTTISIPAFINSTNLFVDYSILLKSDLLSRKNSLPLRSTPPRIIIKWQRHHWTHNERVNHVRQISCQGTFGKHLTQWWQPVGKEADYGQKQSNTNGDNCIAYQPENQQLVFQFEFHGYILCVDRPGRLYLRALLVRMLHFHIHERFRDITLRYYVFFNLGLYAMLCIGHAKQSLKSFLNLTI